MGKISKARRKEDLVQRSKRAGQKKPKGVIKNTTALLAVSARQVAPQSTSQLKPRLELPTVEAIEIKDYSVLNAKVSEVLAQLEKSEDAIVKLQGQTNGLGKVVTIAEISKRALKQNNLSWYQYTGAGSKIQETPRPEVIPENEDKDDDDNFEVMPDLSTRTRLAVPLKRTVPILTIWLTRKPNEALNLEYGYVIILHASLTFKRTIE
jgi:hypothetical protein